MCVHVRKRELNWGRNVIWLRGGFEMEPGQINIV